MVNSLVLASWQANDSVWVRETGEERRRSRKLTASRSFSTLSSVISSSSLTIALSDTSSTSISVGFNSRVRILKLQCVGCVFKELARSEGSYLDVF